MKAYNANAIFLSNVYEQEVGDTNWNEYQVVVTGGATTLNIRTADTTATNLSILNDDRVTSTSPLLLSVDGTTVVSGTVGSVTNGTLKTVTSSGSTIVDRSSTSSPLSALYTANTTYHPKGFKLSKDGKTFWSSKTDGTTMLEFTLSTPNNMNTAATTGKALSGTQGFDFSPDGRYLYRGTGTNYQIERLTLATPWDISTVVTTLTQSVTFVSSGTIPSVMQFLKVIPDGTGILTMYAGTFYKVNMSIPWDVTTIPTTAAWTVSLPNSANHCDCSSDGKVWYWTVHVSTSSVILYSAIAATAWDPRTLGTAVVVTVTDGSFTYVASTSASATMCPLVNNDGTVTLLPTPQSGNSGYLKHNTLNVDLAMSRNIDITSFGLGSAPTKAWLTMPNVAVTTANTAARVSSFVKELELDGNVGGYTSGTASTTTSAVVGIDGTGVLATGDTVLLNGANTVTLTNVVEVSNGLTRQNIAGTNDYIKFNNKTFASGVSNGKVKFSRDGSKMYLSGTGSMGLGIYMLTLSTPWDVSTASFKNTDFILASKLYGSYTTFVDFDIHPDGNSLCVYFTSAQSTATMNLDTRYFTMSRKHELNSITFVTNKTYAHSYGSTYNVSYYGRFNRTGTMFLMMVKYDGSSSTEWVYYYAMTTPYDLSTAGTIQTTTASGTGMGTALGYTDACFTPDGLSYVTVGYAGLTTYDGWVFSLTASVANDITSVTQVMPNNDAALAVNWPAGSNITTSSAIYGIDFSRDGTKFYVMTSNGTITQFNTRTKTINKYTLTYTTQASAPTSVYLPDRSVPASFTTSVVSGNIVQTSTNVTTNSRALQFKLTNNALNADVSKVQVNLRKS